MKKKIIGVFTIAGIGILLCINLSENNLGAIDLTKSILVKVAYATLEGDPWSKEYANPASTDFELTSSYFNGSEWCITEESWTNHYYDCGGEGLIECPTSENATFNGVISDSCDD